MRNDFLDAQKLLRLPKPLAGILEPGYLEGLDFIVCLTDTWVGENSTMNDICYFGALDRVGAISLPNT